LAPLSHMLMNGFFFNQGFDIQFSVVRPRRGLRSVFSGCRSAAVFIETSFANNEQPAAGLHQGGLLVIRRQR
jgi:hypothetical protein